MKSFRSILSCAALLLGMLLFPTLAATADAANRYASVSAAGALLNGNGVTSVTVLGPGQYEVRFNANVRQCAYVATTVNFSAQATQAYTASGHLSANGVYVETKNQGGGLTAAPFNLVVSCGSPMKYAVVGYTGNLVRGSSGTTVAPLGSGRYEVAFSGSVKACAFQATVADPGNGLVFSPSGVYVASSTNPKAVYIETKNPGGGLQDGVPFHLIVICTNAAKTKSAVVGIDGIANRASGATATFRASTGVYMMATNLSLANCATVATRGSVNTDVPFSPATVEIAGGPAPNTVAVQVRALLGLGGNLANEAFHLSSVCK